MVQHERIADRRVVVPQADLRGELHVGARGARQLHAEPRREIGDAGSGQHRVRTGGDDARRRGDARPIRRPAPTRSRARRGRAGTRPRRRATSRDPPWRATSRSAPGRAVPATAPATRPRAPNGGSTRRTRRRRPASRRARRPRTRSPRRTRRPARRRCRARRGAHPSGTPRPRGRGAPGSGRDATTGRTSSTIRSTVTITPRRAAERAPHPLEQRRVQHHVALTVGDERVHERDIGHERREQSDLTERGGGSCERVVRFHRRSRDRAGHDRGQPAGRRLESL